MSDIIIKIKQANLLGRGGANFPVAIKWETVKNASGPSTSSGQAKKYVVCNASEGEPGVAKDYYLLDKYPEEVINGMKIAIEYLSFDNAQDKNAVKGYLYLNQEYYKKLKKNLEKLIKGTRIELFKKDHIAGYIGGEESAAINHLEGKRVEPRLRPPFIATIGLWGYPTLVNNVETFYDVSLISSGKYAQKRFYTINGDCLNTGVYELPESWTIEQVLKETKNYPDFDFFVQVGGDASGVVLNKKQLNQPASGAASITVYSSIKYKPLDLMRKWALFFSEETCGQCTACREGTYRLREALEIVNVDWKLVDDLLNNLEETSFCGLGSAVPMPFRTYRQNVLKQKPNK
jgi:NADH:ubiquinone oxidoreductase subunit F (NADH-binding)